MLHHWSQTVAKWWDILFGAVGFTLNSILIRLIFKRTPRILRTYSLILLISAIADSLTSIGSLMVTVRLIGTKTDYLAFLSGICVTSSQNEENRANFCMFWFSLKVQGFLLSQLIAIFSYLHRVSLIKFRVFAKISRFLVGGICYSFSIAFFCFCASVWYHSIRPKNEVDDVFSMYWPHIAKHDLTYSVVLTHAMSRMVLISIAFLPGITVTFSVASRSAINKILTSYNFSSRIQNAHKSIENVIYVQVLLALCTFFLVIAGDQDTDLESCAVCENFLFVPLPLMAVINPIVTIAYIAPYRNAVIRFLSRKPSANMVYVVSFEFQMKPQETVRSPSSLYFLGL